MDWFYTILIIISGLYVLLIVLFIYGWQRLPAKPGTGGKYAFLSVVIAARNEEHNIQNCLESLASQNYPEGCYEIIIVDDHSSDQTPGIVEKFISENCHVNIRLIVQDDKGRQGKKQAISTAVPQCRGDMVVVTDADCICGQQWLETINLWVQQYRPIMLIGPVVLSPAESVLGKMQALEFCSLAATTAGAAGAGRSLMCNGANLAFCKYTFLQVKGYEGNLDYSSGDDVFLLHKFNKVNKNRILFIKDQEAIIKTQPIESIPGFFRQRMRWASKATGYNDGFTIAVALIVALTNLLLAITFIGFIINAGYFGQLLLVILPLKAIVDFLLLWKASGFFSIRQYLWYFPLAFLIYPWYSGISALGVFSGRKNKAWK